MVTAEQLQKNSHFLKSVKDAKDVKEIKNILIAAGHSCLRILVGVIKACVFKEIPLLCLTSNESKKLKSYKNKLRVLAQLRSTKSR
jgi:hypothetical protein